MERGTIWIIPKHVRPVVSYDKLRKNRIETARSGIDRLNLTDIGESVIGEWIENGGNILIESADLPFPWSASLSHLKEEHARITGLMVMGSTFRSIFRIEILSDGKMIDTCIGNIRPDPLISPYWSDETWEEFYRRTGVTRNDAMDQNSRIMKV